MTDWYHGRGPGFCDAQIFWGDIGCSRRAPGCNKILALRPGGAKAVAFAVRMSLEASGTESIAVTEAPESFLTDFDEAITAWERRASALPSTQSCLDSVKRLESSLSALGEIGIDSAPRPDGASNN